MDASHSWEQAHRRTDAPSEGKEGYGHNHHPQTDIVVIVLRIVVVAVRASGVVTIVVE